jgi:hypothetical protein
MSGLSMRLAIMTGLAATLANAQLPDTLTTVPSGPTAPVEVPRPTEATESVSAPAPDTTTAAIPGSDTASAKAPPASAIPAIAAPVETALPDSLQGRTRHLKSDPQASTLYRSPRKAFFYSLMLPGAGQAYVGHWARASAYIVTEAAIGIGWWYYAVHKSDAALQQSKDYANAHWQQSRYEKTYKGVYESGSTLDDSVRTDVFTTATPSRASYCGSIYGSPANVNGTPNANYVACAEMLPGVKSNNNYQAHYDKSVEDANLTAAQIAGRRASFANPDVFYSLIGSDNEFVIGWEDANNSALSLDKIKTSYYDSLADGNPDTKPVSNPWGTSAMQATYNSFRSQSNDYARMQKWFLGGLILNHLVSALDAALLAQGANRKLYDMESRWWDRVRLQGGIAWSGTPSTQAQAWLEF